MALSAGGRQKRPAWGQPGNYRMKHPTWPWALRKWINNWTFLSLNLFTYIVLIFPYTPLRMIIQLSELGVSGAKLKKDFIVWLFTLDANSKLERLLGNKLNLNQTDVTMRCCFALGGIHSQTSLENMTKIWMLCVWAYYTSQMLCFCCVA